jgi:uncharacterized protein YjbI with pentapeptide repeats
MIGATKPDFPGHSPEPTEDSAAQIDRINELTRAGRANWLGLLTYLAFAFVTVLAVQDADFFIPSRETQLPLINVSIPTFSFFYFAPALAAALYVYLHLHVRKVTEALAEARATVNSQPIEEYLTPWLLNDFVLRRRGDGAIRPRTLDKLGDLATLCLIWMSGPFVTGWFWVRSWPAHDQIMTLFLATCFGMCLLTGHKSYVWMWQKLSRGKTDKGFVDFILSLGRTSAKYLCVFLFLVSWARTEGGFTGVFKGREVTNFIRQQTNFDPPEWLAYDPPVWMRFTSLMAPTDLSDIEFVILPPDARDPLTSRQRFRYDWCKRASIAPEVCGRYPSSGVSVAPYQDDMRLIWCGQEGREKIAGPKACRGFFSELDKVFIGEWKDLRRNRLAALSKPDFSGKDLRRADLSSSTLAGVRFISAQMEGANLSDAQMEGANFSDAQMEGANLSFAQMEGANLWRAQMEGANLSDVQMEGASLSFAQMEGAILRGAQMEGASLWGAQMEGANLGGAQMESANLSDAQMEGANLWGAQMEGANLWGAQMEGASLSGAQMEGANLRRAQMKGASLSFAQMEGANLWGAQMEGASLSGAQMEGANLWGAQMEGANLWRAQMEGASLSGAQMRSVKWAGATFSAAPAHFTDLRGAISLGQDQLDFFIGDETTLLSPGFHVWTCWAKPPKGFEKMVSVAARDSFSKSEEQIRADWLCPEGTEPQKTGTQLGLDNEPP